MNSYIIIRRGGWATPGDLDQAAARSRAVSEKEMANEVRWIRSYVLNEKDGRVGTICIYEATSIEAIRKHAECVALPVDEVIPIANTVVINPDPKWNASSANVMQWNKTYSSQ